MLAFELQQQNIAQAQHTHKDFYHAHVVMLGQRKC